ncbi:TetR/AcrR family transcriptional regulator [Streptomyces sp. NA04227]|uniref:TetR/AcrR family transcriptional regulator n=1 Tax=Streptomyces sp. NA04227 TaxID=2742136 RepID=UPI00158FE131|nr:TetR/AcrR family transcriptional regulator [Streptomyces sp. NA04227]QKW10218.1 TetR/AcrR family transcriptional regulator [Streptomyces sp. NA04227]
MTRTHVGRPVRAAGRRPETDEVTERVLDAAREQLIRFGLRRTTVDDVARAAGIARVTVYRRVGNKEAVVSACLLREYRRFVEDLDAAMGPLPSVQERVTEGFVAVLRHIREHELIGGMLESEPETLLPYLTVDGGPVLRAMRDYVARRLDEERRAEGLPVGGATAVAELMVRITVSFLLNPETCFDLDSEEGARAFARRYLVPLLAS